MRSMIYELKMIGDYEITSDYCHENPLSEETYICEGINVRLENGDFCASLPEESNMTGNVNLFRQAYDRLMDGDDTLWHITAIRISHYTLQVDFVNMAQVKAYLSKDGVNGAEDGDFSIFLPCPTQETSYTLRLEVPVRDSAAPSVFRVGTRNGKFFVIEYGERYTRQYDFVDVKEWTEGGEPVNTVRVYEEVW